MVTSSPIQPLVSPSVLAPSSYHILLWLTRLFHSRVTLWGCSNYCLSRALLVVECDVGVLASVWLYRRVLKVQPDIGEKCIKATCVVHDFLQKMTTMRQVSTSVETWSPCQVLEELGPITLYEWPSLWGRHSPPFLLRDQFNGRQTHCTWAPLQRLF